MDTQHALTLTAKDGKEMVLIPAGEFLFGPNKTPMTLPDYYIDRQPVTNAQYKVFVDAAKADFPPHWRKGAPIPGSEDDPVTQVTWFDTVAYAAWAGKRMPTGPGWEQAARGTDGRTFPWGDAYDQKNLNNGTTGPGKVVPVGSYTPGGDSPYGVQDMSGNVFEWTDDGNPVITMGLRGGSWLDGRDEMRVFVVR